MVDYNCLESNIPYAINFKYKFSFFLPLSYFTRTFLGRQRTCAISDTFQPLISLSRPCKLEVHLEKSVLLALYHESISNLRSVNGLCRHDWAEVMSLSGTGIRNKAK